MVVQAIEKGEGPCVLDVARIAGVCARVCVCVCACHGRSLLDFLAGGPPFRPQPSFFAAVAGAGRDDATKDECNWRQMGQWMDDSVFLDKTLAANVWRECRATCKGAGLEI